MERLFLGIDPGKKGAIALIDSNENIVLTKPIPYIGDEMDVRSLAVDLNPYIKKFDIVGVFEKVGAMPGQGVCAMFTFGKTTGQLLALLKILRISYVEVDPETWKEVVLFGLPWKADVPKYQKDKTKTKEENAALKEKFLKETSSQKNQAKKAAKIVSCHYIMKRYPKIDIMLGSKNPHDGISDAICMAIYAKRKL